MSTCRCVVNIVLWNINKWVMIVYNLIRIFGDNPDNQRKKWVLSGTAIESLYFFLNFPQTTHVQYKQGTHEYCCEEHVSRFQLVSTVFNNNVLSCSFKCTPDGLATGCQFCRYACLILISYFIICRRVDRQVTAKMEMSDTELFIVLRKKNNFNSRILNTE